MHRPWCKRCSRQQPDKSPTCTFNNTAALLRGFQIKATADDKLKTMLENAGQTKEILIGDIINQADHSREQW
jgi:hypothetical protein